MNTRSLVTLAAAALAVTAVSVPAAGAQSLGGGTAPTTAATTTPSAAPAAGSLEGVTGLISGADTVCDLPGLGGSIEQFVPVLGISGVPSSVLTLATGALDDFPNLIEVVAGEDGAAALLAQTGSVSGPLCSSLLGGTLTTVTSTPVTSTPVTSTSSTTSTPSSVTPAPVQATTVPGATTTTPTSTVPTGGELSSELFTSGS